VAATKENAQGPRRAHQQAVDEAKRRRVSVIILFTQYERQTAGKHGMSLGMVVAQIRCGTEK
jgi:hypothetical protein